MIFRYVGKPASVCLAETAGLGSGGFEFVTRPAALMSIGSSCADIGPNCKSPTIERGAALDEVPGDTAL